MSDSLGKLIKLSARMKMPVVAYDAASGESAVLMNIEDYEKLTLKKENFEEKFDDGYDFGEDFESEEDEYPVLDRDPFEMPKGTPRKSGFHHTANFEEEDEAEGFDFPEFSPQPGWIHSTPAGEWDKKELSEDPASPSFLPLQEEEESDEEPIFFEEPV